MMASNSRHLDACFGPALKKPSVLPWLPSFTKSFPTWVVPLWSIFL